MTDLQYGDVSVRVDEHVALVEIHRPPHNYFDAQLIQGLAEAFEALDRDPACLALVLASEGKSFCAGANFNRGSAVDGDELAAAMPPMTSCIEHKPLISTRASPLCLREAGGGSD